jgi:hypothetical protein
MKKSHFMIVVERCSNCDAFQKPFLFSRIVSRFLLGILLNLLNKFIWWVLLCHLQRFKMFCFRNLQLSWFCF